MQHKSTENLEGMDHLENVGIARIMKITLIVVKCSEVLQCSVGLRNKVSNIIRRHTDNMALLLIYIFHYLILSHLMYIYGCVPV
jgi:hypothetical protein